MAQPPRCRRREMLLSLLATAAGLSACQQGSRSSQPSEAVPGADSQFAGKTLLINGAGATFPGPLYLRWFSDYRQVWIPESKSTSSRWAAPPASANLSTKRWTLPPATWP